MTLEFLSGNELKKFPFIDDVYTTSLGGFIFSNDILLDALIHHKTATDAFHVKLTSLVVSANTSVSLTLAFLNASNSVFDTAILTISTGSIVNMETVVVELTNCWAKLVFGRGMVSLLNQNVNETFADLRFTDMALVQPMPQVRQVKLYNQSTLIKTLTAADDSDLDLVLQEGSNLAISDNNTSVALDVFPGYGTGLYDACSDALFISTINSIPPSRENNFLFLADSCYTTTPLDHGLLMENHCKPKCTIEHFDNFVHYLNRIKDGIHTVGEIAAATGTELTTQIADYNSSYVPVKNKPYIKHAYAKFPAYGGNYFYSVVVGIFNTRNEDIAFNITVSHGGTYVTDTGRWRVRDTALTLASPTKSGTLPCLSVGKLEFVFSAAPGATFTISGSLEGVTITPIVVTVT